MKTYDLFGRSEMISHTPNVRSGEFGGASRPLHRISLKDKCIDMGAIADARFPWRLFSQRKGEFRPRSSGFRGV
jgi:hypothetical protein